MRDPVYVDDVADAFLMAGAAGSLRDRLWNLGGPEPMPLARIAEIMSTAAGAAAPVFRPFPEERKRIDIGSFASSWSRLHEEFGWRPTVGFEEGIRRSLDYYRSEMEHYLSPKDIEPSCPLELHAVAVS